MLTIRGTLQLNSLNPMKLSSDVLSQKLLGNYQMLGLSIQPQDLLHMTMLPPEIYVGQEGDHYAVINQNVKINNSTKIEMVNQFLNRILLLDTKEFTYQDEVFISNFLNKMGITDTKEFIEVTRKQLLQNEQITELLEKYTENERSLFHLVEKKQEIEKKENERLIQQEAKADIRYYLQNDIFNRLQAALLNEHIYKNQKYINHSSKQVTTGEFVLSEQIELADKVRLAEVKSKIFHDNYPCAYYHHDYYEQVPISEEQITEQSVLKYLSAAILNNMVSKMAYVRLQEKKDIWNQWISYHRAFYGSSENTIIRFEDMHMQRDQRFYNKDTYVENVNELYQNELAALEVLESQIEHKGEEYTLFQVINTLQQMQNYEKQAAEMIWLGSRIQILQDNRADIDIIEQLKKEDDVLLENKQQLEQFIQQEQELLYLEQHNLLEENYTDQYIEEQKQKVYEVENNVIENQWLENRKVINKLLKREEQKIQFVDMDDYRSYLEQVNERNIQMHQKLQQMELVKPSEKTILIDRKSALKKTLEILEHPNQSIEEILEEGTAILPAINSQIQQILSLVEEPVRELYEKILYHIDEKNKGEKKVRFVDEKNEIFRQETFLQAAMPIHLMETVKEIERLAYSTVETQIKQEEIPLFLEQIRDKTEQEMITDQEVLVQHENHREQQIQIEHDSHTQIELKTQKTLQDVNRSEIQPISVQEHLQKELAVVQDKRQKEIEEHLEQISESNTDVLIHMEKSVEKEDSITFSKEIKSEKEERQALNVQEYIQKELAVVQDKSQKEIEEHLEQISESNTDVLIHVENSGEKEDSIMISKEIKSEKEERQSLKVQEYIQKKIAFVQDRPQKEIEEHIEQIRKNTSNILLHLDEFVEQEDYEDAFVETKRTEEIRLIKELERLQRETLIIQNKLQKEVENRFKQENGSNTDVLLHVEEYIKKEGDINSSTETKRTTEEIQLIKELERLQSETLVIQNELQKEIEERLERMSKSNTTILQHVNEYIKKEDDKNASLEIKRREEIQPVKVEEQIQRELSLIKSKHQLEIEELLEQVNRSSTYVLRHVEEFTGKEDTRIVSIVTKKEDEEIQQISKETTNILKRETQIMNQNVQSIQHTQQINLVHRNNAWQMDQQEINELLQKKKTTVDYQQSQIELTDHITVLEKKIQETKQEAIIQSKKSITELIQQNLQSQVNTISEQVYQKLEHRLWSERKRRGF